MNLFFVALVFSAQAFALAPAEKMWAERMENGEKKSQELRKKKMTPDEVCQERIETTFYLLKYIKMEEFGSKLPGVVQRTIVLHSTKNSGELKSPADMSKVRHVSFSFYYPEKGTKVGMWKIDLLNELAVYQLGTDKKTVAVMVDDCLIKFDPFDPLKMKSTFQPKP